METLEFQPRDNFNLLYPSSKLSIFCRTVTSNRVLIKGVKHNIEVLFIMDDI